MSHDPFEPLVCPITDCPETVTEFAMYGHLEDEHDPAELITRLVELAPDLPYHRSVECQKCGTSGARPGDHPLCAECEREVGISP
ncbi:hypothetical protein [Streptomyces albipurpureus]|uniref:C2H2-type domain-containing protein n=1 Tax=Streptomyces albipurpureus TaxID=2897419 RepID=A0ABT0V4A2_9ACTN|nr:hypothetical protein [Streptomyces sp. CWNU-1]MCM2394373.1 hypothetical protein [Streptomyces sp. CWNU-1]